MHAALRMQLLAPTVTLPANSAFPDRTPTAAWTAGFTANFLPGPDGRNGNLQSVLLQEGSGSGVGPDVYSNTSTFTSTTATWRLTYYVKPYGPARRFLVFYLFDAALTDGDATTIDLSTGIVTRSTGAAFGTTINVVRTEAGRLPNNWFKVYQYFSMGAGANNVIELQMGDTEANAVNKASYTRDGASGALIWGIDIRAATDATG